MPFMKGLAPIRRTWKYLSSPAVVFKDRVKIVLLHYNTAGDHHAGLRDFIFWYLPRIQYQNPDVQIVTLKNFTPSPFIRFFLDNSEEILMDVDSKKKDDILDFIKKILGKSDAVLAAEKQSKEQTTNPANFGSNCTKHCLCEVQGQVPCPSMIQFPKSMRGKYRYATE